MLTKSAEANYPISFREETAKSLGENLKNRHSVVLVGIRRVGISNFLKFFTNQPDVIKTYVSQNQNHLFIMVDLNDLVERELYPFWVLTLKRISDSSKNKEIQTMFLEAVQSQNLFLLIDSIRKTLLIILKEGYLPTIFFNRFDRIKDALTPQFYSNLEGLKDACRERLSYVFTSFRQLEDLTPVFKKASLSLVSDIMYLPLATKQDLKVIYENFNTRHHLTLTEATKNELFKLVGGYIQYLYLSMIALDQTEYKNIEAKDLIKVLLSDETIKLQSEEIWESLSEKEQAILNRFARGENLTDQDKEEGKYLLNSGIISNEIFSPIFETHLKEKTPIQEGVVSGAELSKKELALFNFLKENLGQIAEREAIITSVWPDEEEVGVSDWAIDRLVSRLRSKLKQQNSPYEIITVKTRGFKLLGI